MFGGLLDVERLPVAVGFDLDYLAQLPVPGALGRHERELFLELPDLLDRSFAVAGHSQA